METVTRERLNIGVLATSQAFYSITAITVMTLSGLVGLHLSPDPALATLPVSAMMLGTLLTTLPASLYMQRVGRRTGFLTGTTLGGLGGLLSVWSIGIGSFWMFCAASLLFGVLIHQVGWAMLNLAMMPFVLIVLLAALWLRGRGLREV